MSANTKTPIPPTLTLDGLKRMIVEFNEQVAELKRERDDLAVLAMQGSVSAMSSIEQIDKERAWLRDQIETANAAVLKLHGDPQHNMEQRISRSWERLQRDLRRVVRERQESALHYWMHTNKVWSDILLQLIDLADPSRIASELIEGLLPRLVVSKPGASGYSERNAFIAQNARLLIEQTELPALPNELVGVASRAS